jgi:eukaryotic-like serine/threonine-protein kinase
MSLAPGARVGPYEIRALLGEGGMGQVYRAFDTQLGREVAIKFLPHAVADDATRRARFEREAQTVASLNHPNIAQIYGLHGTALVMELLDGTTLTDRIAEGALPFRKIVDYGVQMARGLAAAHDRGIVHRDLKPDNVVVLKDGHVKIIDFGLARGPEAPQPADDDATNLRLKTDPGVVMGTVGYMAPEQVRAAAIDGRTDLFAFGVVLYEMITGRRAFKRDTTAETMTAILREDPPEIAALRADTPPALVRIVQHCLEKNPIERFQTARDVAFALDSLSTSGSAPSASGLGSPSSMPWRVSRERVLWLAACVSLSAVALWLAATRSAPRPEASAAKVDAAYRATIPLPDGAVMPPEVQAPLRLAIAPDGQRIAFVRRMPNGSPSIWEYSLATGLTRMIPGTENGVAPIWSDDGEQLLFTFSNELRQRDGQGRVTPIPPLSYGAFLAGSRFMGLLGAPGNWTLVALEGPGATPTTLFKPSAAGEDIIFPKTIPGTQLFTVVHRLAAAAGPGRTRIEMGSPDGGPLWPLVEDALTPSVAGGHLLFSRGDRLFAQPLDLAARSLTGEPTLLAEHLEVSTPTGAAYAASDRVIVYATPTNGSLGRLTMMQRDGSTVATIGTEDESYSNIELSPDGRRVAVSVQDVDRNARDIYVVDLQRGVRQRLTFDPTDERAAIWARDGRSVIYNSKGLDFYRRPSDFGGTESALLTDHVSKDPRDVSPDGREMIYRLSGQATNNDIWAMSLTGDPRPHAVLATPPTRTTRRTRPTGGQWCSCPTNPAAPRCTSCY